MRRRFFIHFLVIWSTVACQRRAEFVVPATAGSHWFKGNTHSHTTMSDGDSAPEVVARWYKEHGYRFLVLSDHNVFTDPTNLAALVDSTFLLIPGEEITAGFRKKPVHVNGLNLSQLITPVFDSSLVGTIQKNVDAIRATAGPDASGGGRLCVERLLGEFEHRHRVLPAYRRKVL